MNLLRRLKVLVLASVLALAFVAGANEVRKAHAGSPPTTTWGCFEGSITAGATATIVTGATGQRIIVLYADLAATGAGIVALYEKTSGGVLTPIKIADVSAATQVVMDQNNYFGGSGYVTASGSSVVLYPTTTLTVTGNVRALLN